MKKIAEKTGVFCHFGQIDLTTQVLRSLKCCDHAKLNTCMRIHEVIRAKTPDEQRIAALKANRDRAAQALKAERDRQRMNRAQRQLANARQLTPGVTKQNSVY